MFAGRLVSELAPHFGAFITADTARLLLDKDADRRLAMLGAVNLAGLAYVFRGGVLSQQTFESGLVGGLGSDYREELESRRSDLDWRTPPRQLVWPFRDVSRDIEVIRDVS